MTTLFERRYRLRINDIVIKDLDITFSVTRSLKKEPNTAEISVFNLSPDSRAEIEERGVANVTLEAGYKDEISLIFAGDLREVQTVREGPDIITTIASGDGEKQNRVAKIARSYAKGVSVRKVIEDCAVALGVGLGNLRTIGSVEFPQAGKTFPNGTTLNGLVTEELRGVLRSAGLEYSIQDGQLQILEKGQPLKDQEVVVLSPNSGLVGTASVGSDGIFRGQTLMIADVTPGRQLKIDSPSATEDISAIQSRGSGRKHLESFSGIFRAQKCIYTGDTSAGETWNIEIEGAPLFKVAA